MKNPSSKRSLTSSKAASDVSKSTLLKSNVKKGPTQVKQKKTKLAELNVSIKDKLSGKIYSPTVEKSKRVQQKKTVKNTSTGKMRSSPNKKKTLPSVARNKQNKATLEVKKENTTLPVQKNTKNVKENIKNEKGVISKIEKKPKVIAPKVSKSNEVVKGKGEVTVITSSKRKMKSDKSELLAKKLKVEELKVENRSSSVLEDVKKEDQSIVAKPRQAKMKRKSSLTSIKDLKPISNIKSLVKKPSKTVSKAQIKKKLEKFPERGVCYFSHIPHGFYEKELKNYCSQFGEVTGVYHPVSKLGNSRGYAFVEFKHKEVAEVVAETMNNYLMFNRLLKCEYVPPESQRPWVFKQDRDNMKAAALRRRENLHKQMRNLSKEEIKKWKKRRETRVKSLHKKLAKLGLDYEFQVNNTNENVVEQKKKDEQ